MNAGRILGAIGVSRDPSHLIGITPVLSDNAAAAVDVAVDGAEKAGGPIPFIVKHRANLWGKRDPSALIVGAASPRCAGLSAGRPFGPAQAIVKVGATGASHPSTVPSMSARPAL
jgi:hypothetical protein